MLRYVENFRTDFHLNEITTLMRSDMVKGGTMDAKSLKLSEWLLVSIGNVW